LAEETNIFDRLKNIKATYFPERQLFLRSEGRVRFLTISSYFQIAMALAIFAAFIWGILTSYAYLTRDITLEQKNREIADISADYQSLSSDFTALEAEIERRATQLEERQRYLEQINAVEDHEVIEQPVDTSESADEISQADEAITPKASLFERIWSEAPKEQPVVPVAERREQLLARLERLTRRQNDLAVQHLSTLDSEIANIQNTIEPTSVTVASLVDGATETPLGIGGPYIPVGEFEPVFDTKDAEIYDKIIDSAERLKIVTKMLDSFPAGEPAAKYYLSSKFGRRIDPIKKTWSTHYALDLAGWPGTAIQAAAPGKVVKAGWLGPYGQMIEIDHGNGFRTRYGHMRKLRAKKGDIVELGQRIGDMGKTGRVTDTHLHYEIWYKGKVIDPLPFLKAGNDVLEIKRRHKENS
jgi:murein DD-endopeptidase MepM/ murein hydrolase activator NlpD